MNTILANRKVLWLAGIVLGVLYFAPNIMNMLHRAAFASAATAGSPAKPSPVLPSPAAGVAAPQPAVTTVATGAATPEETAAAMPKFVGVWDGGTNLVKRGTCMLHIEVQASEDKGKPFTGYSSISCAPSIMQLMSQAQERKKNPAGAVDDLIKATAPVSTILGGTLKNGAVTLDVQKTIGLSQVDNGCPVTSITLTPFAADMAAEWKETGQDACQGGQLIMKRTR